MSAAASVSNVLVATASLVAEQLFQTHDGGQGQRQLGDDQCFSGQQSEHAESQRYSHATHHERIHEQRVVLVALFATFINIKKSYIGSILFLGLAVYYFVENPV